MRSTTHKFITAGLVAHVDAGKTTLAEAMLYAAGSLRHLGRVDHRDSYLDDERMERERGITIFSKQAVLELGETTLTLLDTPGHVDFSAEMERSLQVLDYALLVISGSEGVQAHTETVWKLLEHYHIPVFLFITKMDLPHGSRESLLSELQRHLSEHCLTLSERGEALALCSEESMDEFLETGTVSDPTISSLITQRKLFPCFFGSGLKSEGIEELLAALEHFTRMPDYGEERSARVFKLSRDTQGKRLSFLKVLGGSLTVRDELHYRDRGGEERREKIQQLRVYNGAKFTSVERVYPGQICAVLGLSESYPGLGLGACRDGGEAVLESVMSYRLLLPEGCDPIVLLQKLRTLDAEDPQLHILWNERTQEISVQLMGAVQAEIFRRVVADRFDTDIRLDTPRILYRETIENTVEGVGHFEPLRHYAEVHLLLEPLPRGSGLEFDSLCSEDELDRNWQRLVLTHLMEKQHLGVLTGSPITDMRICLVAGRTHIKHTEGGDVRQATYRAVRQGLMQAKSVLLEPWYAFSLELPMEQLGRAINDIRSFKGSFSSPEEVGGMMRLTGSAPVAALNGYQQELLSYTHGRGKLTLLPDGYRPCHEQDKIVAEFGYEPTRDEANTPDSVFCSHGAGTVIPWNEVFEHMHLEPYLAPKKEPVPVRSAYVSRSMSLDDKELEAIMQREFGAIRRPVYSQKQVNAAPAPTPVAAKKESLIVDGYNLIFASDTLKALALERLDLARGRLLDLLSNYSAFTKKELVLVFDGFRTPGNPGSREDYHNIHVVYTRDGESADAYIERLVDEIGKNYAVRVITSDNLIRLSALRSGVLRTSSKEFLTELKWSLEQMGELLRASNAAAHKTTLAESLEGTHGKS